MANNTFYPRTSPYYLTDTVNDRFLDVMVDRPIPKMPSDIYWQITVVYNLRPDLLAFDLYGDSRLWWVFASRNPNGLKDPYFDFTTGLGIYLPKAELLRQVLGL